ncbi:MAG: hypothetical protein ACPHTD_11780, partial [Gammaproteobacteria bacterium]
ARAPHAASQHVAASQACVRGGAKVWLQHFFSAEQHVGRARAVARGMGENPQAALAEIKALLTANATESDLSVVQEREFAALDRCYASPEHREAINAFLEKRPPDFTRARTGRAS